MPNLPQEVHSSYEYDRSIRTVSPTTSHHSSSFSESSAASEHVLTPNTMNQSTPFIPKSTALPGQHMFRVNEQPLQQHIVWQSQVHNPYSIIQTPSNFPPCVPSQPSLPMRDIEMIQHDDESNLGVGFNDHVDDIHSKSPRYMPQPQELEYSEEQDDSSMSNSTDSITVTTPVRQSIPTRNSDDETEEEEDEEPIAMDHDSDSDYENRPTRRRASRTTPKQKHTRKSSNSTTISQTSRVHKRTSSSSTITSTISISRGRHNRTSSKSLKGKPKGPFTIPASVPKSDRVYPCAFHRFGCTSEFPNKNEWKRHVACQHLQLGYYRCDLDGCDPDTCHSTTSTSRNGRRANAHTVARPRSQNDMSNTTDEIVKYYNDFNRKDLFTQHCRRMHGPSRNPALCSKPPSKKNGQLCPTKDDEAAFEAKLTEIRRRCWHVRRHAPRRSWCGFCKTLFDASYYDPSPSSSASTSGSNGLGKEMEGNAEEKAWEERMEHVGKHYEKEGADCEDEELDDDLVDWGLETGVLKRLPDGRPWLIHAEDPDVDVQSGAAAAATDGSAGPGRKGSGNNKGTAMATSGDEETPRKKARRQPSRTAVRVSFKEEDMDDGDVKFVVDSLGGD